MAVQSRRRGSSCCRGCSLPARCWSSCRPRPPGRVLVDEVAASFSSFSELVAPGAGHRRLPGRHRRCAVGDRRVRGHRRRAVPGTAAGGGALRVDLRRGRHPRQGRRPHRGGAPVRARPRRVRRVAAGARRDRPPLGRGTRRPRRPCRVRQHARRSRCSPSSAECCSDHGCRATAEPVRRPPRAGQGQRSPHGGEPVRRDPIAARATAATR